MAVSSHNPKSNLTVGPLCRPLLLSRLPVTDTSQRGPISFLSLGGM